MADAPTRAGVTGAYLTSYAFGPVGYGAARGQGSAWFGPLAPMAPSAPPEVIGRQFDYPVGANLQTRPRAYAPIDFHELRALADGYDLLRTVIETRKDQIARVAWSIKSRDEARKDKNDPRVEAVTAFFQKPDGEHDWAEWLRSVLEDLFVIDAASLYLRRNRGGQLVELVQIDGATIKPVIDDWGRTPRPYTEAGVAVYPPAYQQVLKGLPAVDYSTFDMIYKPRNRRVHTPYGMSPVEQIVTTVNIALRRQLSTLSYFTEGNIPDMLVQVPQTWTPDQIAAYQRHWDAYFTGDLGRRRRAKFVPGGTGTGGIHETRTADLKGDFDEWLAKLVCFAFSVSPQALTRQMNRASADTQKQLSEEEGLEPILLWVKSLIDDILAREFGADDLEFAWDNDDQVDEAQQLAVLTGYVSKAIMTINEARDRIGLDPLPDPEASQALIITGTGAVPLNSFAQAQQQQQDQLQANAEAKARIEAAPPAANDDGGARSGQEPGRGGAAAVAESGKGGAVAKFSPDQARDADGKWTGGEGDDAKDWTDAKDAAFSVAKGIALTAASALAVALAPEAFVGATATGIAVLIKGIVDYQAENALYDAAIKSGSAILRQMGFDVAKAEEKVKSVVGLGKAAPSSVDAELRKGLVAVSDHVRDEIVDQLGKRKVHADTLKVATHALDAATEAFKARFAVGKSYTLGKRRSIAWRKPDALPFDRAATVKAEAAVTKRLKEAFDGLASKFAAALRSIEKLAKADDPDPDDMDRAMRQAGDAIDAFDLSDLQDQAGGVGDDLEDTVTDTVKRTIAQIGPDDADGLTGKVNKRAVAFARARAAELVGMKRTADGSFVPSDDADMAITDSTREMLRKTIADGLANNEGLDAIADDIASTYGFSEERAAVIAATEVSRANSMAALESYQAVADSSVPVRKAWLTAPGCCDFCAANEAVGAIDLDDNFPSDDTSPPAHPNCRCALTPVVGDRQSATDAASDDDQE